MRISLGINTSIRYQRRRGRDRGPLDRWQFRFYRRVGPKRGLRGLSKNHDLIKDRITNRGIVVERVSATRGVLTYGVCCFSHVFEAINCSGSALDTNGLTESDRPHRALKRVLRYNVDGSAKEFLKSHLEPSQV
jgi:hypothetical protein